MSGATAMQMCLTPEAFSRFAEKIAYMPSVDTDTDVFTLLDEHALEMGYEDGVGAFLDLSIDGSGLSDEQINKLYADDKEHKHEDYWKWRAGESAAERAKDAVRSKRGVVNEDEEVVKIIAAIPPAVSSKWYGRQTDEFMYIAMTRSKTEKMQTTEGEEIPKTYLRIGAWSYADQHSELARIIRDKVPEFMKSVSRQVMRDLAMARTQSLKANPAVIEQALMAIHRKLNAQNTDERNITGISDIDVSWAQDPTAECDFEAIVTIKYVEEPRGAQQQQQEMDIERIQSPQPDIETPQPRTQGPEVMVDRI